MKNLPKKAALGIVVIVIIIVALAGGTALWQSGYLNCPAASPSPSPTSSPTPTASSTPTPEPVTQEQARDAILNFAKTNHNEITPYMQNLNWTGGRVNTGLLGATKYTYISPGWNVTIQNPVIPNPIYTVKANYTQSGISMFLQGTWQNGTVAETIYINNQLPAAEQVRNDIVNFLRTHADAVPYLQTFNWTGGNITPEGLVGSSTYSYINNGWNVTMQYPIVPNPIYAITANYNQGTVTIVWRGTWQNTNITETSYVNNQLPTNEQVLNALVNFLRTNHTETVQYLQSFVWTELSLTPEGLVGSSKFSYLNQGWNVTMQYPVVLDPIYTISANCTSPTNPSQTIIAWHGTWQNQTITETSYIYTP